MERRFETTSPHSNHPNTLLPKQELTVCLNADSLDFRSDCSCYCMLHCAHIQWPLPIHYDDIRAPCQYHGDAAGDELFAGLVGIVWVFFVCCLDWRTWCFL